MPAITPTAVLGGLNNGSRSIWDLASLFQVSAGDPGLRKAIDALLETADVVASDVNIFTATLRVAA